MLSALNLGGLYLVLLTASSVYRFLGLDDNVLHHLKTFQSPVQPAAMSMFEHRGLIFWLITETFTDALGSLLPDRTGRLYVYAVRVSVFGGE